MTNILLGKILKAMYKLSGKTLTELSESSGLTVDTINNLFYARIQKPGFLGVSSLVEAMGFCIEDICRFREQAEKLPVESDVTNAFTKYIFSVRETEASVDSTESDKNTAKAKHSEAEYYRQQIRDLNENHELQFERFRQMHFSYVEQIKAQYQEQISQLESSTRHSNEFYEHNLNELQKLHSEEIQRQINLIRHYRHAVTLLIVGIIIALIAVILVIFFLKQ